MDGARFANALATHRRKPRRRDLAAGRRRFVVRLRQERRAQRRGADPVRTELADEVAIRRKRAGHLLSKGRMSPRRSSRCWTTACGSTMRAPPTRRRRCSPKPLRIGWSIRSKPMRYSSASAPRKRRSCAPQGFDFYDWGPGEIRLVTSWDQQGEPVERLAAAIADSVSDAQRSDASRTGRPPVHHLHGDLGLDLDRHPRPARRRPAAMVGHLPLRHRGRCDGAGGGGEGRDSLRLDGAALLAGALARLLPVLRQLQCRLSRRTAHHVGRRRDGLRVAPDPQHPARLGLSRRSGRPCASLWSSLVAVAGIVLLFLHEIHEHAAAPRRSSAGIGLTARRDDRRVDRQRPPGPARNPPLSAVRACSPGRWRSGAVIDACRRLRLLRSAGVRRPASATGSAFSTWRSPPRRSTFSLYYPGRAQDRPGQGRLFERARADHRDGFSTSLEDYRWTPTAIAGAVLALGGMAGSAQPTALGCRDPDAA